MEVKKILGLDWGTSKIGIAITDSETRIAFAYGTIENDKKVISQLAQLVQTEDIEIIVLGKLEHTANVNRSFVIEDVGKKLSETLGVPVEYQEEMFSTKMAENNLKERGAKKIKKLDNQEAARIILQSWLEKKDRT